MVEGVILKSNLPHLHILHFEILKSWKEDIRQVELIDIYLTDPNKRLLCTFSIKTGRVVHSIDWREGRSKVDGR